ncbi:MAG: sensor histidine kinase [Eggerthellaceae bacterium]|nr:sensor histidine kinase [Eggerthellaceae bacterium]
MPDEELNSFLDKVCADSRLRVEADLGDGFVRLRTSEVERRQAKQDIRSSEDIVIELLRNARDAGARHIYVATQKRDNIRTFVVMDDGKGIPASMHRMIFEPRVTSKLDSAHMDKWGIHGRGMALYSISENSLSAEVMRSETDLGSVIRVVVDSRSLPEKTDQSSFPNFERQPDRSYSIRGPKNILRTVAEFALEHSSQCEVFCGTFSEMCACAYELGLKETTLSDRVFTGTFENLPFTQRICAAADPADLKAIIDGFGMDLSQRTCRRIMDGTVEAPASINDQIREALAPRPNKVQAKDRPSAAVRDRRGLKVDEKDVEKFRNDVSAIYKDFASRYYLDEKTEPQIHIGHDCITVKIPVVRLD